MQKEKKPQIDDHVSPGTVSPPRKPEKAPGGKEISERPSSENPPPKPEKSQAV
jgi:hypothetical protein